jgi:hypothetical protein
VPTERLERRADEATLGRLELKREVDLDINAQDIRVGDISDCRFRRCDQSFVDGDAQVACDKAYNPQKVVDRPNRHEWPQVGVVLAGVY